tara:strand:- start:330 stop:1535 length:1206 start_codon:yes stop_codon:yes gene_type:complete
MNKKKFKINPKVWSKEYTFEEFKQLNPTIAENLLINYYTKYLQEYAEDRSRHLKHFNDKKNNLSKELNLLNEKLINNTSEWSDGDTNVGPTAAGRKFRSPLDGIKHSMTFDGTDDFARAGLDGAGNEPSDGTLKPYSQLTVAAWIHADGIHNLGGSDGYFKIVSVQKSGGYVMDGYNKRIRFNVNSDDGDGTSTLRSTYTPHASMKSGGAHYTENGWHYIVGTYDGRYVNLYADGYLTSGGNETVDIGFQSAGESGSAGAIFYKESSKKHLIDFAIGCNPQVDGFGNHGGTLLDFFSGSIAEVAVWDKALDATTIAEIYENNVSGSSPKFDLSYSGYPGASDYDIADEGLNYTNVGQYANNLQGWWKLDENTGTTLKDFSGNERDLTTYNSPSWSGSHAPS